MCMMLGKRISNDNIKKQQPNCKKEQLTKFYGFGRKNQIR